LTASGIRYRGMPEAAWIGTLVSWALSVIAFVLIWNIMMRRLGGVRDLSGMGKSQARVYVQQETGITFDDIAGIDEAKAELQQIVAEELKMPSDFKGMTPIMYSPLSEKPGEIATQVLTAPIYEIEAKINQLGCREL
jgi:ATP-dependent Zn protease